VKFRDALMQSTITSVLVFVLGAGAALAQMGPDAPSAALVAPPSPHASKEAHAAAIANCEAMWEQATHMTRKDWARACRRVQTRLQQLELR
jgi:hypothetical protein